MSSEKLVNFRMDDDIYQKLKMLALKERKPVKDIITNQIEDYVKKHGDGNPQFTIDQFEDPNFIACPAFYRSPTTWDTYLKNQDPKELEKVKQQILMIDRKLGIYI